MDSHRIRRWNGHWRQAPAGAAWPCKPLVGKCAVPAALLVHGLTAKARPQDLYVQSEEDRMSQPAGSLL